MRKKILYSSWIIINICIVFFFGTKIMLSSQEDVTIENVTLYNWLGDAQSPGYFNASFPASKYWFSCESGRLEPGVYNISVYYNTNSSHFYLYCDSDIDGNKYPAIYSDDYLLDNSKSRLDFTIWVNDKIDTLKVAIECGKTGEIPGDSYLEIDKIEIIRSYKASVFYRMLGLLMKMATIDALICLWINKQYIKRNFYVLFGLSIIFGISSIGAFTNAQVIGHDLPFHWGRIIGLQEGICAGQFPVKIQPAWCNDYGYATSVFYGDILLYIPAILYALKLPIVYAYKAYVLLINAGTVWISYYCYKKISNDKYIAVGCAALYCLSPNRIFNVLLRAAVGEYTAYMFFPLIVLGMWNLLAKEDDEFAYKRCLVPLVLGMTGVIQTHTLSFEMVSIFLIIVCVITVKKVFRKERMLLLLKAAMVTILLNLWFFVPFLDYSGEKLNIFTRKADGYGIQHFGLSLYELLSIGTVGTGRAVKVTQGLVERYPASLGLPVLAVGLMVVIYCVKYPNWKVNEKKQFLEIAGMAVIPIYFSTYYFPWNKLAEIPLLNNVISSIQFPWRFLSIAMPMIVLVACLLMLKLKTNGEMLLMKGVLLLFLGLSAYTGLQYTDMIVRNNMNYTKYDGSQLLDGKEVLSGTEYLYEGTNIDIALTDRTFGGEKVYVINTERNSKQIVVTCVAEANGYLEVPLFAYPYYECKDEQTGQLYTITRGNNNKIRIDFTDDYEGALKITFMEPWYWRLAEIISLISWICFAWYVIKNRR